jgi:hypothetical protein
LSIVALVLVAVAWTALSSPAHALVSGTGTLAVATLDAANKPVGGALVNVFPAGSSTPAATGTTNSAGKIAFNNLPAGNYTVFASKVILGSYAIFGSANATVTSGGWTGVTVKLTHSAP